MRPFRTEGGRYPRYHSCDNSQSHVQIIVCGFFWGTAFAEQDTADSCPTQPRPHAPAKDEANHADKILIKRASKVYNNGAVEGAPKPHLMNASLLLDAHICLVVLGADGHGVGVEHRRRFLDRNLPAPKILMITFFIFFFSRQKARHGIAFFACFFATPHAPDIA